MDNSSIVNFNVTRPELCIVGVFVFSLLTISVYSCMSYLYPDELIKNVSQNQINMPSQNLSDPKKPFATPVSQKHFKNIYFFKPFFSFSNHFFQTILQ